MSTATRGDCAYPDCPEPAICTCEICDTPFCSDHGSRGVDEWPKFRPSECWKCGGFNIDE